MLRLIVHQSVMMPHMSALQVLHSTLAFFAEHLGASAAERYPRPAIDERRMALLEKLVTPSGERSKRSRPLG